MKTFNILFVCKYNRFRSKLAEAYFKKINKNKKIKVSSGGLFWGTPTDKNAIRLAKEFKIKLSGKPKGIRYKSLKKQDLIVIVANNVPKKIFKYRNRYPRKVIVWRIPDELKTNEEIIKREIKPLLKKLEKLNKQLEKGKWM